MKRIRKTITAIVSALVIALMALLPVACGDGDETDTGSGEVTYTITLKRSGGDAFDNTLILATGPKAEYGRTNSEGVWSFTGPKGTYDLNFDVPDGYVQKGYKIDNKNRSKTFSLTASLISEPAAANKAYKLGDVMHDFSFTDSTGETGTLSDILKTKKAVMLNFWFVGCTWCIYEFPGMQRTYEKYKDDLEIIAISGQDSTAATESFRQNTSGAYDWDELTFPMVGLDQPCSPALLTAFGVSNFPTSVMIDREGVICFIVGTGAEEEFETEFARYTADDYVQFIQFPNKNTQEKPNVRAPSAAKIAEAINADGFTATYYHDTNEYNWPWIIDEDGNGIKASNSKKFSSFAILYADFEMNADQALAFDYKVSSEEGADYFYVYIDGEIMHTYSGQANYFSTCYAYVPLKAGKHTLALSYIKDETKDRGDDTVYIKNIRFEESVGERTEILYRCATGGLNDNGDYSEYITPVYNEDDGYYHVGTANGPLVIADVLNPVKWERSAWEYAANETGAYAVTLGQYVTISNLSRRNGFVGVTKELKESLDALMAKYGNKTNNDKEWLDLCYYYIVYAGAENETVTDPAEGLAAHNAYPAKITAFGAEDLILNHVNKTRVLMPRGIWYKIVPERTAVYRIRSVGDTDTYGWLRDENGKLIAESSQDTNPYAENSHNFSMSELLEAGKPYYIAADSNDVDYTGEFDFVIEDLGASGSVWTPAASGGYTGDEDEAGNITNLRVAGAVDYVLGEDNCYHVKNADGSAGAMLYIDLLGQTDLFPDYSIEQMISIGGYYCKNCGSKYPTSVKVFENAETVMCYCGNRKKSRFEKKFSFDLPTTVLTKPNGDIMLFALTYPSGDDYDLIQYVPMYDISDYTGSISSDAQYLQLLQTHDIRFTNYTGTVLNYVADARDPDVPVCDPDELGGNQGKAYAGYVPASKELVNILQKFIVFGDYSMSPNITNAWLMMASYFKTLG